MDHQILNSSENQWPVKSPKNKIRQILLGVIAVIFVFGVAGASYYVSNQLSSRVGIAPTAPESEPAAAGGCTNNPKQCKDNETCQNGVCRLKSKVNPTPTTYSCTSSNCPGPAFYCSSKTNCANSPGWEGGVPKSGTPTPTKVSGACTPGEKKTVSCQVGGVWGESIYTCCSNKTYTGCAQGQCYPMASGTCTPNTSKLVSCTMPDGRSGQRNLACCSNGTYNGCAQTPCYATVNPTAAGACGVGDCNVPNGTPGSSTCVRNGQTLRCCNNSTPEYSATSNACKPAGASTTNICASGLVCSGNYTSGAFTCKQTSTSTNYVYCCHDGETISGGKCVVPGATGTPTTPIGGGGGGTPAPTSGGGGGGGGGGGTPTASSTKAPTATATPTPVPPTPPAAIAGACMEIFLYSKKADGTFNTTPMTAQQKQGIKFGDTIRLAIRANKANLLARFRVTFNNIVMMLPGPIEYSAAPNQRFRQGFIDPQTKLISYYDFTATRSGEYKFEGFVSTDPQPLTCGGFAGTVCPTGYRCEVERNVPDALGICIQLPD